MKALRFFLLLLMLASQVSYAQGFPFPGSSGSSGTGVNPNYNPAGGGASSAPVVPIPVGFSFTPPPTDLSVAYLSDIFGVVGGVLHGTGSQLLGTMFGVFNAAILTIGGVVIAYTLFVSTLNTAHEGKVMGGKWSNIWLPIRTVIGVGAMLPNVSGYSFIQIFLMWLVLQGIGAADSIWYSALNYLQRGGILVQHVQSLSQMGGAGAGTGNIQLISSATGILRSQICMYTLRNGLLNLKPPQDSQTQMPTVPDFTSSLVVAGARDTGDVVPPCYPNDGRPQCGGKADTTGVMYFPGDISYAGTSLKGVCGKITWKFATDTQTGAINYANLAGFDSRSMAVQQMVAELQPVAYTLANMILPTGQNQTGKTPVITDYPSGTLTMAATDYLTLMKPYLNQAGQQLANNVRDTLTQAALRGWILAGSYYFTLSRLNQMVTVNESFSDSPGTYLPKYDATPFGINPSVRKALTDPNFEKNLLTFNSSEMSSAQKAQSGVPSIPQTPTGPQPSTPPWWQQYGGKGVSDIQDASWLGFMGRRIPTAETGWWITNDIINFLPNQFNAVVDSLVNLVTAQQNNIDPMLTVSSLGYAILHAIETIWLTGLLAVMLTGLLAACSATNPFGFSLISGLLWFVPLLTAFLFAMWVAGAVMAFYIPLIPTIIFLFTTLGWFFAVIEAMIAGPLVALGMISPEGDHEIFGHAKAAIMLTLNIFIRPTLIIFGFITACIMVNVALWLWNLAFATTLSQDLVQKSIFSPGTTYIVSLFAMIFIYMTVVLSIVNRCFALIHEIPTHVLSWIGHQGRGHGEAEAAHGVESGVGQKFAGAAGASKLGGMGGDIQKAAEARHEKRKKDQAAKGIKVGGG